MCTTPLNLFRTYFIVIHVQGDEAIEHWIRAAALARITYGSKDYHYALCHIRAGCCYLELLGIYIYYLINCLCALGVACSANYRLFG